MVIFCSRHKWLCDELRSGREMLWNTEGGGLLELIVQVFVEPDARLLSIRLGWQAVSPGSGFDCHARHLQPGAHPYGLPPGD